jgi:hypothetical protein
MKRTFKQINNEIGVRKKIVKHGLILGISFSKDEIEKFELEYEDELNLDNAEIIKKH